MKFEKYHGTGNDFIIFERTDAAFQISDEVQTDVDNHFSALAKKACHRHFGIGADGMMLVSQSNVADVKMIFYNADGSTAPMCGNGIRCFAKYVYDHQWVQKQDFTVETLAGIMKVRLDADASPATQVTINMGLPLLENLQDDVTLNIDGTSLKLTSLIIGTDHCVIFTDDLSRIDVSRYGAMIENHPLYPNKINVNFVEVVDFEHIRVSTYERGVGKTLSCGTGSAASAVVSHLKGYTDKKVNVSVPGGRLIIEIKDDGVFMTGPAERICTGDYNDKYAFERIKT